ncbi:MAG: hypothetical protein J7K23_00070 [Thermoproteales archaeon]|nr:hypothetical protein [Thermoproteales archaeon]
MSKIKKAVILSAGLGTRLIPYSKEMPKEMLPLYTLANSSIALKPILQIIFEQLYEAGIRDFCFIVGRGKRHIEDHFTPDWDFVEEIYRKGKEKQAILLEKFYNMIENSLIVWINQPVPMGTGDAILRAKKFVDRDIFLTVAGDNIYLGKNIFKDLIRKFSLYKGFFLTVKQVEDATKYGVIEIKQYLETDVITVKKIIEKPKYPPSNLANTSIYVMFPEIFSLIEKTKPSPRGEIEITDTIQMLIDREDNVYGYIVKDAFWIDVGNPISYLKAISYSLMILDKKTGILTILYDTFKDKISGD